jgi:hypothetical protein
MFISKYDLLYVDDLVVKTGGLNITDDGDGEHTQSSEHIGNEYFLTDHIQGKTNTDEINILGYDFDNHTKKQWQVVANMNITNPNDTISNIFNDISADVIKGHTNELEIEILGHKIHTDDVYHLKNLNGTPGKEDDMVFNTMTLKREGFSIQRDVDMTDEIPEMMMRFPFGNIDGVPHYLRAFMYALHEHPFTLKENLFFLTYHVAYSHRGLFNLDILDVRNDKRYLNFGDDAAVQLPNESSVLEYDSLDPSRPHHIKLRDGEYIQSCYSFLQVKVTGSDNTWLDPVLTYDWKVMDDSSMHDYWYNAMGGFPFKIWVEEGDTLFESSSLHITMYIVEGSNTFEKSLSELLYEWGGSTPEERFQVYTCVEDESYRWLLQLRSVETHNWVDSNLNNQYYLEVDYIVWRKYGGSENARRPTSKKDLWYNKDLDRITSFQITTYLYLLPSNFDDTLQ